MSEMFVVMDPVPYSGSRRPPLTTPGSVKTTLGSQGYSFVYFAGSLRTSLTQISICVAPQDILIGRVWCLQRDAVAYCARSTFYHILNHTLSFEVDTSSSSIHPPHCASSKSRRDVRCLRWNSQPYPPQLSSKLIMRTFYEKTRYNLVCYPV